MGLFNFLKKKEEIVEVEEGNEIKEEKANKASSNKRFSLLCINIDKDEYSFTLTANNTGKISINKSMFRDEYNDTFKTEELRELIEKNHSRFKELVSKVPKESQKDNLIQIELEGEKHTLFRTDSEDDVSLFYDMLLYEIAKILDISKTFEDVKINLSFEYPNDFEMVPTDDLEKYCLLSGSKPLVMFHDNSNNNVTFEYLPYKKGLDDKIIESITESDEYELLTAIDLSNELFDIKSIIVNYNETNKVEALAIIVFNNTCLIYTMYINEYKNVNVHHLLSEPNIKKMIKIFKSFRIIDEDFLIM